MEFDLDKALEEVPIHVEDPPPPAPPQTSESMSGFYGDLPPPPRSPDAMPVSFGELPPVELKTLEHCTKLRPKPKNRMRPTRPPVSFPQKLLGFGRCFISVKTALVVFFK